MNSRYILTTSDDNPRSRATKLACSIAGAAVLLIGMVVLSLALGGCQEPVEPNDTAVNVFDTVRVLDQGGAPVVGAEVRYGNDSSGVLPGVRFTGADGEAVIEFPIPIEGARYSFRVSAPAGDPDLAGQSATLRNVPLPCLDTALVFNFTRQVELTCTDQEERKINFNLCYDREPTKTLSSPSFTHDCPTPQTLSATLPTITGMTIDVIDPRNNTVLPAAGFSRGAGEPFMVRARFTPGRDVDESGEVVISGGGITVTVPITAVAKMCTDCECPGQNFNVSWPKAPAIETVCVGSSKDVRIPLGSVSNSNREGCSFIFTLKDGNGFASSDLEIVSVNGQFGGAFELPAGESLDEMIVRFEPTRRGDYVDRAVYMIQRRNPDGSLTTCGTELGIDFRGRGAQGICFIDAPSSTMLVPGDPSRAVTLGQCVGGKDSSYRLCLRNDGDCDLTVRASTIDPRLFTVTPQVMTLAPGEDDCFVVRFEPTVTDVWPPAGDRRNTPRMTFNDNLTLMVEGPSGGDCLPASWPLVGVPNLDCCKEPPTIALNRWSDRATGIRLAEDQTISSPAVGLFPQSDFDIYTETIALGTPGSARIVAGRGATFKKLFNRNSTSTICALRNDPSIQSLDPCIPGTATSVDVVPGDIVAVSFGNGYCGLMYIDNITTSKPPSFPNSIPVVLIRVGFPI